MTNDTMPPITLYSCDSSQIHAHGYDPDGEILALQFKRSVTVDGEKKRVAGSLYYYENFTRDDYQEFLQSKSKGEYFGAVIKPNAERWPYRQIS